LETGTAPEETQGTWQGPGNRYLSRVHGTSGRPAGPGRSGNWPTWCSVARSRRAREVRQLADLVQRGQARPPPSHTWRGPCSFCPAKVFLTGSSELTITARPTPNAAPARLNVRKSIDSFSAQKSPDFRRAVKQALTLNDKRGSDYFASWHAVAPGLPVLAGARAPVAGSRRNAGVAGLIKDRTIPAACASAGGGY
jgi:hypothetical protein